MPIHVRVASDLGLVVIDFEGVVTTQELAEVAPLVDKPEYGLLPLGLGNATNATRIELPSDLIRHQARRSTEAVDGQIGEGARMALVATNPEFFGLGRMYSMLRGDSPVAFNVFRSLPEAEEWLELPGGYADRLRKV